MLYIRWILALGAIGSLPVASALAVPSHKTPDATLDVRTADPVNQALYKRMIELYAEIEPGITQATKNAQNQQWKRIKVKQLYETSVKMLELERNIWWLKLRGEPASADYTHRLTELREQLNTIIVEYRKLKEAGPQLESIHTNLVKDAKKKAQGISKLEKLIEQKNFPAAEKMLFEATDPMIAAAIWFEGNPAAKEMAQFQPHLQTVQSAMNQVRTEESEATLIEAREKLAPDFDDLLKRVIDVTDAIKTSGQAEFDGEKLTGPALVAKFGEMWQVAHLATIQSVGLEWARGKAAGATGSEDLNQLVDRYRHFSLQMTMLLGKLVEADGARVSADQARSLYYEYLGQLAPLVALSSEPKFSEALDAPLKALAAKDPALATQAEGYGRVMGDLLRWRGRTARALAHAQEADYPELDDQCRTSLRTTEEHVGLVHDDAEEFVMVLKSSVPKVMPQVLRLMDQKVSIGNWVGLSATQPLAIGQLQRRAYARITRPGLLADAAAALEQDLLVSETAPPLTLESAIAVATAKRGDLLSVGGTITGVYLESMTNRYALLSAAGRNLLPLGPLDVTKVAPIPLPHVLLRFDVDPAWACHPYYFVSLK